MTEQKPDAPDLSTALPDGEADKDIAKPLDEDAKLDIALKDSMMTSEPPQISEPRTAADEGDR